MSRLDEIQARADAATPGPWEADTVQRGDCVVWGPNGAFIANHQAEPHWLPAPNGAKRAAAFDVDKRDCEFIAHAREDVPWLIERVRELEAQKVIEFHHHDLEAHAEHFNEGYEAAMAQHLADDPSITEDWLNEQKAKAWDEGADAMHTRRQRDESLPLTNPYRAGES
jgi:hypothetical protein